MDLEKKSVFKLRNNRYVLGKGLLTILYILKQYIHIKCPHFAVLIFHLKNRKQINSNFFKRHMNKFHEELVSTYVSNLT